ncbi:MAG TPA: PIG-L deacetylase family protein [Rectinemataceae bacterium]|nr:PIG-L deacetylase family protein [Rectinemataceae bacterium]
MAGKRLLVISAHAADYVWRSGGTITSYLDRGAEVKVIVLSYGIRGESNDLWKTEGQTAEGVRNIRHGETSAAASILGIKDIEYWDFEDYPMDLGRERLDRIATAIRRFRPDDVITHGPRDAFNPDHEKVSDIVFQACVIANSSGAQLEGLKVSKQMGIFGFEPHQTEISDFKPGTIIDISGAFERKKEAMACFKAQKHLIEYYTMRALMRGNHHRRISGDNDCVAAEAFSNFFPTVGTEFA